MAIPQRFRFAALVGASCIIAFGVVVALRWPDSAGDAASRATDGSPASPWSAPPSPVPAAGSSQPGLAAALVSAPATAVAVSDPPTQDVTNESEEVMQPAPPPSYLPPSADEEVELVEGEPIPR